jgi:WD40 repeat protein/serine/threonine protein kinase
MKAQTNSCKECGKDIPADNPGGFCAQCLLELGLDLSAENPHAENQTQSLAAPKDALTAPNPDPASFQQTVAVSSSSLTERAGDRVGRYRLLQEIGQGGCGVVYMAEQEEPVRRRVAVKVIKLGMDTKQVVARFEAERQALALMDHPNIAKVLDAGATDAGRPYFVMELVRGIRITDYCDQNKLPTSERLKLFTQVCQAIQHAHQKGVIHRDIKPSNILVTLHDTVPVPKVIDFGIAKATQGKLTDQTLFTAFEQFIGTPAYMSPEQVEVSGLDIDTRSDIYSLGVLLYELLVGTTPFAAEELVAAGIDQMRRVIREKDPVRPSTRLSTMLEGELTGTAQRRQTEAPKLIHLVRGDLDWIVMKCLEKDRTRRYETANGLAMDIQRHLTQEPVLARPPSTLYRTQKFVRRNKVIATAAAIVTGVLVMGVLISTWQAVRATRAEQQQARLRNQADAARVDAERQRTTAQAQEQTVRRLGYVSDMNVAAQSLVDGDAQRARQLLERHRPKPGASEDLRGFEWRYLWGLSRPGELLILPNSGSSARFSPDGRILATGNYESGEVKLWDSASHTVLRSFKAYEGDCWWLAFSPDGQTLATSSRNIRDFKLWDVATGNQIGTLLGSTQENFSVSFSPDGKRVATIAGTAYKDVPAEIKIWNLADQKQLGSFPGLTSWGTRVEFSPTDDTLVTGDGQGLVKLWNWNDGTVRSLRGHNGMVFEVRFSPDGKLLATGDLNGTIILWDWATGSMARVLTGHQGPIYGLAISRDGHWLASASRDHTARLWDVRTGEELDRFTGHSGRVWSVELSPDGQTLVTTGEDRKMRFWKVGSKREGEILARTGGGNQIGYSPDGRFLFVDEWYRHRVTLWDLGTKTLAQTLPGKDIRYSPDGKILTLIRETNLVIFQTSTMRPVGTVSGKTPLSGGTCISPDGKLLALRREGRPLIVDLEQRREITSLACDPSEGSPLLFSPDSKTLVVAKSKDGAIGLWNARSGQPAGSLGDNQVPGNVLALSPDGLILAIASETTIQLWNLATRTVLENSTLKGNTGNIGALAFSPDGKTLAAGSFDGPIKLWNIAARQEVGSLKAHLSSVWGMAFSPDGRSLASTSYDYTVRLWKAPSFQEIETAQQVR